MKNKFNTHTMINIAIFAAINAILSQITIPLPFTPVPISLGLLAVFITGVLLSPGESFIVELLYLIMGGIGFPVFAGFKGGLGSLSGPTGGYLFMYPIVAWICSFFIGNNKSENKVLFYLKSGTTMIFALAVLYTGGTLWLSKSAGIGIIEAISMAIIPFIILDISKIVFTLIVIIPLKEISMERMHKYN